MRYSVDRSAKLKNESKNAGARLTRFREIENRPSGAKPKGECHD